MKKYFPIFVILVAVLLTNGLYQALEVAPREATMGDMQRIFYCHFPSAMTTFALFFVNFVASVVYLFNRKPSTDAVALSTAEVGVVFCTVMLATGILWAKPAWGVWWTWDLRLTTALILWLIYVSYLLLRRFTVAADAPVMAAVLAIFGFADVPLVYMAIRLKNYRGNHPTPVSPAMGGKAGSGMAPEMWHVTFWNLAAWVGFAIIVFWLRYQLERTRQRTHELHATQQLEPTEVMR